MTRRAKPEIAGRGDETFIVETLFLPNRGPFFQERESPDGLLIPVPVAPPCAEPEEKEKKKAPSPPLKNKKEKREE